MKKKRIILETTKVSYSTIEELERRGYEVFVKVVDPFELFKTSKITYAARIARSTKRGRKCKK